MDTRIALVSAILIAIAYSTKEENWGAAGVWLAILVVVSFGIIMQFAGLT